jgi:hypothetical protein
MCTRLHCVGDGDFKTNHYYDELSWVPMDDPPVRDYGFPGDDMSPPSWLYEPGRRPRYGELVLPSTVDSIGPTSSSPYRSSWRLLEDADWLEKAHQAIDIADEYNYPFEWSLSRVGWIEPLVAREGHDWQTIYARRVFRAWLCPSAALVRFANVQ